LDLTWFILILLTFASGGFARTNNAEQKGARLGLNNAHAHKQKGARLGLILYARTLNPARWLADYTMSYLERDVRQISQVQDLSAFQRFLRLCAGRTGQLLNLSSLAQDAGIAQTTARAWLSVLEASYIVFLLQPHHRNLGKRIVKMPKLYFLDTALAASLMGIQTTAQLAIHPLRGALFETLIVSEFLKARFNAGFASNLFFWRDNVGLEVDLLLDEPEGLLPIEIKSSATVTDDLFKGLRKWLAIAGDAARLPPSCRLAFRLFASFAKRATTTWTRAALRLIWRSAARITF
jgi:hypothetical protein